jgi:hypothetical protein
MPEGEQCEWWPSPWEPLPRYSRLRPGKDVNGLHVGCHQHCVLPFDFCRHHPLHSNSENAARPTLWSPCPYMTR